VAEVELVMASANPDKAAEIAAILGAVPGIVLRPRPANVPDVDETGDTLMENARLKAVALMEATGMAAVSDDTGLEIDALDGAPGVYSARYSGERATYAENVAKVVAELERVGATAPSSERPPFARWPLWPIRGVANYGPTERSWGPSLKDPPATPASGTTRCSSPTAAGAARSPR
jgi:XTP/dITP diphosphohydrolase